MSFETDESGESVEMKRGMSLAAMLEESDEYEIYGFSIDVTNNGYIVVIKMGDPLEEKPSSYVYSFEDPSKESLSHIISLIAEAIVNQQ